MYSLPPYLTPYTVPPSLPPSITPSLTPSFTHSLPHSLTSCKIAYAVIGDPPKHRLRPNNKKQYESTQENNYNDEQQPTSLYPPPPHAHTHTHTHTHIYTHTHAHTYIHTHTHTQKKTTLIHPNRHKRTCSGSRAIEKCMATGMGSLYVSTCVCLQVGMHIPVRARVYA